MWSTAYCKTIKEFKRHKKKKLKCLLLFEHVDDFPLLHGLFQGESIVYLQRLSQQELPQV